VFTAVLRAYLVLLCVERVSVLLRLSVAVCQPLKSDLIDFG